MASWVVANSRVTAVPGTNAFISTFVSQIQAFTGSSISCDAGLNVFPMPARDIINVELSDDFVNTKARISIHSMYGNLLQSTELTEAKSTQMNVSKLHAGMYMLRIVSGNRRINKTISIID